MKRIEIMMMTFFCVMSVLAQKENNDVRTGNKRYDAAKFTEAEIEYRRALQANNKSFEANFNLGNALFKQEKFADAMEQFQKSAAMELKDKAKIAATYHNLGNALLAEKKIEQSIEAYKAALKANPHDDGTRYNLAYAQALLKKQDQNEDQKKDQNKDQNKDQDKEKEQDQKPDDQQKQPQQPQMSKEQAEQMLQALMQDEKNTKEKAQQQQVGSKRSADKDW